MAFEKEIKAAKKIADGWMDESLGYEGHFIGLKKDHINLEKSFSKTIEAMLTDPAKTLKDKLNSIEASREFLDKYEKTGEKSFADHAKFVRGAPRAGAAGVCAALSLKAGTDAYKAVSESLTKLLVDQSKQFIKTEAVWTKDVKPRLDLLKSRLDTLEKIAKGQEDKLTAFTKQFQKDAAAYIDMMKKAHLGLKLDSAVAAISEINTKPKEWMGGEDKKIQDQVTIYADRAAKIDQLMDLSVKNYNRVLKSLADDVRQSPTMVAPLAQFAKEQTVILQNFTHAKSVFAAAVKLIEKVYA